MKCFNICCELICFFCQGGLSSVSNRLRLLHNHCVAVLLARLCHHKGPPCEPCQQPSQQGPQPKDEEVLTGVKRPKLSEPSKSLHVTKQMLGTDSITFVESLAVSFQIVESPLQSCQHQANNVKQKVTVPLESHMPESISFTT